MRPTFVVGGTPVAVLTMQPALSGCSSGPTSDDIERCTFHRGGTTVVLTLAGPHGAEDVGPWRLVTESVA